MFWRLRPIFSDKRCSLVSGGRIGTPGCQRFDPAYVRHEDEPRIPDDDADASNHSGDSGDSGDGSDGERWAGGNVPGDLPDGSEHDHSDGAGSGERNGNGKGNAADDTDPDEDEGIHPLSDLLLTELTAYRSLRTDSIPA